MGALDEPAGPWFRRRPRAAAGVATVLFLAVTVLRFASGDERDATALLFALPITLLALAFGFWVGVASAGAAVTIVAEWVAFSGASLSAVGWVARVVPLALLGALVGWSSDQQARAEQAALARAITDAERRDAAEINDAIVQRLTAAKWSLEAGRYEQAEADLAGAIEAGEALVASLLAGTAPPERRTSRPPDHAPGSTTEEGPSPSGGCDLRTVR